ncbi:hypothetical protein HCAG_07067 [Histoplasma mississippiense (nom. inval.)]|uniref:hypothetical protein n=1 Tax=Ajellomyces capsulatus (strain NAm1 / WU24) TaxID=2059318 RepID=UPI000157CD29|nr:hypothetical protein HCAG_07067 [Histoplasma mississippiense (nom. inval.)]EDN10606.1 hypothetical protein HCAG_07067 [Histoplasma mississippiense (nom. inval.)]
MLAVLLGKIFGAFSGFGEGSLTSDQLIHTISAHCVYLLGLGIIILLLQAGHFTFWMAFGELQAKNAREKSFVELLKKDISWFEMKQDGVLALLPRLQTSSFSCIDAVKYFNGQNFEAQQYSLGILAATRWYRNEALGQALQIGCGFWYGISLVEAGQLNPGDVVTAFWACLLSTHAIEDVLPHIIVLEKGRASSSALQQLIKKKTNYCDETDNTAQKLSPTFCEGDIRVKNVTFSYPSRPDCYVLKDSSFFFPAGDVTFVVGRSGSGKSTLSNLLMRFYTPTSGAIFIDGTPLENLNIYWIRNNITLVQQQSFLFNETVFTNIAFGSRDYHSITEDKILNCLRFACLDETVRNLPDGLDTMVGAGGSAFSGGQRQRVAIARARLRDTPILILDESTSALDFTSRFSVMDAIRVWRKVRDTRLCQGLGEENLRRPANPFLLDPIKN